ncbi:hypothetical protein KIW84_030361 [Lathyrus oleraceus]|uniref:Uncharacterized protein n=1 Tax=Pisum sativum TaxID=3888 RepID=A0A9D4XSU0_PEA|nr:hypothetical protein KIW84_030361 [Pisum sativum]
MSDETGASKPLHVTLVEVDPKSICENVVHDVNKNLHCPDAFPPQFCARVRGIDSKSNGSSCEFIDDSSNIEPDNDIGIRGGLSLCIIEISWGGNDIITNCLAKECFGGFLHLFDASSLSHTYEA